MPDPAPVSKNEKQLRKTTEVVNNMSRGFIILLEYSNNRFGYNPGNIPDVYGIRLCQTRVRRILYWLSCYGIIISAV